MKERMTHTAAAGWWFVPLPSLWVESTMEAALLSNTFPECFARQSTRCRDLDQLKRLKYREGTGKVDISPRCLVDGSLECIKDVLYEFNMNLTWI